MAQASLDFHSHDVPATRVRKPAASTAPAKYREPESTSVAYVAFSTGVVVLTWIGAVVVAMMSR
jgi:hypothetical protein